MKWETALFGAIASIFLVIIIYLGLNIKSDAAIVISGLLFVIFLCMAFPDRIAEINLFKGLVKTRELQKEITQIKVLAEANTRALFEILQTQMRFSGKDIDKERRRIFFEHSNVLKEVGSTDSEIVKIQERWHYWIEGDYVRNLAKILLDLANHDRDKVNYGDISNNPNNFSPDDISRKFDSLNLSNERIKILIDDFRYYKKNKDFFPDSWERWLNREHWKTWSQQ